MVRICKVCYKIYEERHLRQIVSLQRDSLQGGRCHFKQMTIEVMGFSRQRKEQSQSVVVLYSANQLSRNQILQNHLPCMVRVRHKDSNELCKVQGKQQPLPTEDESKPPTSTHCQNLAHPCQSTGSSHWCTQRPTAPLPVTDLFLQLLPGLGQTLVELWGEGHLLLLQITRIIGVRGKFSPILEDTSLFSRLLVCL